MNQDFIKAYEYLEKNCPQAAEDIYYSLEFFTSSLDSAMDALDKAIAEKAKNYSAITEIAKYGQIIDDAKKQIGEYLDDFASKKSIDETIQIVEEDADEKSLPNYKDYAVNEEIPHTLTESFTHKKICGFMLNGVRYNVSNWQDALIKLREILLEENPLLFSGLVGSKTFKGRKNSYFSKNNNGNKYYHKLNNNDIYVWTNLSTSMICEIIRKLLREYSKSINSIYIYLRADYTPLHIHPDSNDPLDVISDEDKIGKHVRTTMRKLSSSGYSFAPDMLSKLTNKTETKKIFGVGMPFLLELSDNSDISVQMKDINNRNRYWKEVFEFNGKKYLITSQWFDYNRERFEKWYKSLNI